MKWKDCPLPNHLECPEVPRCPVTWCPAGYLGIVDRIFQDSPSLSPVPLPGELCGLQLALALSEPRSAQ